MIEEYIANFIALVDGTKLSVLMGFILGNLTTGIAASIYRREFRLKALADFMFRRILAYVVAYFGVAIIALVEPAWKDLVTAVWGILLATLLGHILGNLREMGVPIPISIAGRRGEVGPPPKTEVEQQPPSPQGPARDEA
jgi:phage-related holin